jgi:hypothetical protein
MCQSNQVVILGTEIDSRPLADAVFNSSNSRASMKPLAYVVAMLAPGFAVADSAPILNFDHAAPVTGTVFDRGDIWRPLATNGYSFFVRETVWATHLAVYDDYQDGLVSDYDVGL